MKNIFYTGVSSAVGNYLSRYGCKPLTCDITDPKSIANAIDSVVSPDVIINLAGKSDPDFCQKPENQEEVIKVNLRGAYNLALEAEKFGIPVVFLSTDHIFDGKHGPYKENAKLSVPVNFYGASKLSMEAIANQFRNVKIVRTSYLFYYERIKAHENYPTFLNRSFMYLPHFAQSLYEYACRIDKMPKILHISGSQTVSWYEFYLAAASVFDWKKETINPRRKELKNFDGAPRPHKAGLKVDLSKKLMLPQHDYLRGLRQMKIDHINHELGFD
jgi:dTDP-4-dehydrorhamnose reductase